MVAIAGPGKSQAKTARAFWCVPPAVAYLPDQARVTTETKRHALFSPSITR
jgi:hypothetical protein|tara:strand:- start:4194 stop:4346 length:153 start_codon:yes stop_codon:yes gene_type:complete